MEKIQFPTFSNFKPGDRVILPTGETGKLCFQPNIYGWIVERDRDKQRFYYRDKTLQEVF